MAAKAKAQANKMAKMDAAVEATLAETHDELTDELASVFWQSQDGKVKVLRRAVQKSQTTTSEWRIHVNSQRLSLSLKK
jgi:hypothetical protein